MYKRQCPDTVAGAQVGSDGCEVVDNDTDEAQNGTGTVDDTDLGSNLTVGDDGEVDLSGDDGSSSNEDGAQSSSDILGLSPSTIGIIAGVIVVLLLSVVLVLRGRSKDSDSAYDQQQMAYASVTGLPPAADPTITPEQLAYEQQLVAAGYPADYARTYADQHFRPWLKA